MGEFLVVIFKASWGSDESIHLLDKGDYDRVDKINNTMSYDRKEFAIETARQSLNKFDNHNKCAEYIKNKFDSKYGGNWAVILQPRGYGSFCCSYMPNCSIQFLMGEFEVIIFKTS